MYYKNKSGSCPYCGGAALTDLVAADVSPYEHILDHPNRLYQKCDSCAKQSVKMLSSGTQYPLTDPAKAISGPVAVSHAA